MMVCAAPCAPPPCSAHARFPWHRDSQWCHPDQDQAEGGGGGGGGISSGGGGGSGGSGSGGGGGGRGRAVLAFTVHCYQLAFEYL